MVSIVTALIAASAGFMIYLAIPVLVTTAPIHIRQRVGTFYLNLAARCLKQFTFVRRVLSGYDIIPINVDDEQKLLKVTLSSSTLGSDSEYRFADPDNRVLRLFNKPVAAAFELVPAAIDAELSEWGHWVREKKIEEGLNRGDYLEEPEEVEYDPYVEASDGHRLVDPIDVYEIVPNDVDSENIKTGEQITKKRYELYNTGLGMKQTMRIMFGFAAGAGGVMAVQYVNEEVLGGGSGGAPIVGEETLQLAPMLADAVVMLI